MKTRFERCSEKVRAGNAVEKGPEATQESQLGARDCQLGAPEPPTRRPRRPTWRPRRPNLAFRGRSKRVPVPPRAGPECPSRPKSKFHRFFIDFRLIFQSLCTAFGLCQALLLCSADSVRLTKRRRKTHGYRSRLAFGCSSLPVRVPRSNPQLASRRFTRCSRVSAPSN